MALRITKFKIVLNEGYSKFHFIVCANVLLLLEVDLTLCIFIWIHSNVDNILLPGPHKTGIMDLFKDFLLFVSRFSYLINAILFIFFSRFRQRYRKLNFTTNCNENKQKRMPCVQKSVFLKIQIKYFSRRILLRAYNEFSLFSRKIYEKVTQIQNFFCFIKVHFPPDHSKFI